MSGSTYSPTPPKMPDVASRGDNRGITIQRVGIRDLHLPVMVLEKSGRLARLLGIYDASVELPKTERGTHMSRLVEVLAHWSRKQVSQLEMELMLREIAQTAGARAASLTLAFKYFLEKTAPASGIRTPLDYDCRFEATLDGDSYRFTLVTTVPIITLCPCSREISERGAHSQRALLTVQVRTAPGVFLWLEDLIPLVEKQGSCDIHPVLKRSDEKVVTETSYDNPKFVEDVVRDTIIAVRQVPGVEWLRAECESMESIHNHLAYAMAESEAR